MANTKKEFRCFDVVSDDSDHYFLGKNVGGNCFADSKSRLYRRIMREWKFLDQNLPESIYVRAYERRIDLLRAVIIGPAGTPYHDGLFFFDIAFPYDYPENPPKIHFHSFGLRLNPNLYANGKVSLSLLNPPFRSTLLHVLLYIQILVLNVEPFFNKIPFKKRSEGIKSSRVHYDESAFALTCHISLCLIRRPPKNFEAFISHHFRDRGSVILAACKEYGNERVRVGYYGCDDDAYTASRSFLFFSTVKVSTDFQVWLERVYRELFEAFLRCGASLDRSLESLDLQKLSISNIGRIFKKVTARIKKAIGKKKISSEKHGSSMYLVDLLYTPASSLNFSN